MRDGCLRGALSRPATQRQMDVLAAFVAAGGSVPAAAELVGIRPSTVKRHLTDLRARSGLTTVELIYAGERLDGSSSRASSQRASDRSPERFGSADRNLQRHLWLELHASSHVSNAIKALRVA